MKTDKDLRAGGRQTKRGSEGRVQLRVEHKTGRSTSDHYPTLLFIACNGTQDVCPSPFLFHHQYLQKQSIHLLPLKCWSLQKQITCKFLINSGAEVHGIALKNS